MDFIKKMKKREFIEMSLKTVAAVLSAFIAVILMEGMIYGIYLNYYKTKSTTSVTQAQSTVAYCIKESDDKYFVLYYNDSLPKQRDRWSATSNSTKTKAQCEELLNEENPQVKEIIWKAPSASKLSMSPVHYVVITIFIAGVAGYFVYKFVKLKKLYDSIEKEYKETGTISITNV